MWQILTIGESGLGYIRVYPMLFFNKFYVVITIFSKIE